MQFKLDENLPAEVKQMLIEANHSASTAIEQKLGGQSDEKLSEICRQEKKALITLDWDFSDIRTYPPQKYSGIVVLDPSNQGKQSILKLVSRVIPSLEKESLNGRLWIVEPGRIRIREEESD